MGKGKKEKRKKGKKEKRNRKSVCKCLLKGVYDEKNFFINNDINDSSNIVTRMCKKRVN